MPVKQEKFYLNGKKILKQTLNKYIKWASVLSAIKNGANDSVLIRERLGNGAKLFLVPMKKEGFISATNRNTDAIYSVTPKGEKLIDDIKQYEKEKKNEENRMFECC